MDQREVILVGALQEIVDIVNNYGRDVTRGMILEIANRAINSD